MGKNIFCIWFTGLSGSGKSAIADELAFALKDVGLNIQRIDEAVLLNDILRKEFADQDEEELLVRLSMYVASLLINSSQIPIVSIKTTKESYRKLVRESIPESLLVYTKCKLSECEKRDPHNLFSMNKEGKIKNVPGVDGIFEEPAEADIVVNTFLDNEKLCTKAIIGYLDFNGHLKLGHDDSAESSTAYTSEQEGMIKKRLEDLGYL